MSASGDRAWDFVPAGVSSAAGAIAIGYAALMDTQGDSPRAWFLGGLLSAAPEDGEFPKSMTGGEAA